MRKVLIVEDEEGLRKLLRAWLESAGYEVLEASNGEEFLEMMEETSPDLVILDIMMPKLDGWSALRELKTQGVKVPIIILSAKDTYLDFELAEELGVSDYFVKPFEADELLSRIRELVEG